MNVLQQGDLIVEKYILVLILPDTRKRDIYLFSWRYNLLLNGHKSTVNNCKQLTRIPLPIIK